MLPYAIELLNQAELLLNGESDETSKTAFIDSNLRTADNPNGLLVGPRATFFGQDGTVCTSNLVQRAR